MTEEIKTDLVYDAGPTGCGELIMNVFRKMKTLDTGQIIKVVSYDSGAKEDLPAWCRLQGHQLLKIEDSGVGRHYWIKKGK
ncbi:tRNA 2-thiouridine synthesizing protein A [Caldalkalibacillus uzonensis]|uniref:tRNA 2-thiouridine synthesizing protein A n=1 Tax=Caldalkalibacillus uzonensis TaxID=353224 RepID=A0ABU0CVC5_9BACI|nr:sulfurtransferase TusA family protein [Caldalkalibacillus uzonensis]MDQ0339844.1 tRNA 2-thiouridine synthesizing protein A [Caldalkalibacillus uzonensis]